MPTELVEHFFRSICDSAALNLNLKVEGDNPTGSFKDRGMTMAITKAKAHGAKAVICASTGNTSASAAAYAAHAGITAAVLVPEGHVLEGENATLQDTNDHVMANLQKDGTYSVVPRMPGGEVTPDQWTVFKPFVDDETLRYLQGLPPTPDAVSGITETMRAGFPVYTTWADPHPPIANADDYSCVRNNIVTVGDIFTHRDKSLPGNTRTDEDFARPANPGSQPGGIDAVLGLGGGVALEHELVDETSTGERGVAQVRLGLLRGLLVVVDAQAVDGGRRVSIRVALELELIDQTGPRERRVSQVRLGLLHSLRRVVHVQAVHSRCGVGVREALELELIDQAAPGECGEAQIRLRLSHGLLSLR